MRLTMAAKMYYYELNSTIMRVRMNRKASEILDKTIDLLAKTGLSGVSMDEIAAFAGASKMTVYKYFSDKAALFDQVGETVLTRSMADLSAVVHADKPLVDRMSAFLAVSTDFVDGGYYRLCEVLQAISPRIRTAFAAYSSSVGDMLKKLIDEGFTDKLFLPQLDRQMVFDYINMGILYYQKNEPYRERMKRDIDYQNRIMSFLVGNIFLEDETVYP